MSEIRACVLFPVRESAHNRKRVAAYLDSLAEAAGAVRVATITKSGGESLGKKALAGRWEDRAGLTLSV